MNLPAPRPPDPPERTPKKGWTVYILECRDGSYYSGMTRNLFRTMAIINGLRPNALFSRYPNKVPAKLVFEEFGLRFKEAYAKHLYLKEMTRRLRKKLITTGKWPIGGALREYIKNTPISEL